MSEGVVKALKFLGLLAGAIPIIGVVAVAGQKIMTLEEAVKNQEDQTTAIHEIQTTQAVLKTQQKTLQRDTDAILRQINKNHDLILQILQR
jgi:hypothetical protein